jgi:hypothetical protein
MHFRSSPGVNIHVVLAAQLTVKVSSTVDGIIVQGWHAAGCSNQSWLREGHSTPDGVRKGGRKGEKKGCGRITQHLWNPPRVRLSTHALLHLNLGHPMRKLAAGVQVPKIRSDTSEASERVHEAR